MLGLSAGQVQPIGVDIGCDGVKLLQTQIIGQMVNVRCAASERFASELREQGSQVAAAAQLIRRMLKQHPFRGRRAVVALPQDILHVKNLRLPMMPASDLESAVQFEARHMFPFEPEQLRMQFLPAGEVRQGSEVRQELIVFAAPSRAVDDFVEQLHACGLGIESLDAEPCAIFRGFERFLRRREDEQNVQVVCDVGYDRSCVVIGRGREMTFYKRINIGGRDFDESVSRKVGISTDEAQALRRRMIRAGSGDGRSDAVRQAVHDAVRTGMEELTRELSLCLRYYSVTFRGSRPTRVLLVGDEARDGQLLETLSSGISIPVETGWPTVQVDRRARSTCGEQLGPEWSVALGLSLKLTRGQFTRWSAAGLDAAVGRHVAEVIDLDERISSRQQTADVAQPSAAPPADAAKYAEAAHA